MYLLHFAVIDLFARNTSPQWRDGTVPYVFFLVLVVIVTSAVAKVSGVTLEKWSSNLAKLFIAHMQHKETRGIYAK